MSFLTLLLYIICTFLRPQDWVPMFYGKSLVNMLALATAFFLFIERSGRSRNVDLARVPQNGLMGGLFVAIIFSHLIHTYFAGLTNAVSEFLVNFVLYFLILNGLNKIWKFRTAIWLIIFLVAILVPQGVYQIEHGYGWAGQWLTRGNTVDEWRINWIGIFNDPNDLALIFVVSIGMLLAFLFSKTKFFVKALSIFLISMLVYGVYLTNSRGGMLALMATVFFFFVKKTRQFVFGSVVGGVAAAGVFLFGPSRLGLISTEEASAQGRINLWYEGIQLIKRSPFFGVGYDMYTADLPQTAHNSYILAAAELGLFGLFFWMALLYSSYKGLDLVMAKDKELEPYALGVQSGLIGFCAAAFFLSRTYVVIPYILFALSGSLVHIAKQRQEGLEFRFTQKDVWWTIGASLGILVMVYATIKVGLI